MNSILMLAGLAGVYFGYRLFCGVSRRVSRVVAGAILAVFGMAILAGGAKAIASRSSAASPHVRKSTTWHNGAARNPQRHVLRQEII